MGWDQLITTIAAWTQVNFFEKASEKDTPQFVTIPYSHYVEFARWTWLLTGRAFEENWYMPGQHILPVLSLRVARHETYLSSSSFVSAVGRDASKLSSKRAKQARSTAVPAVVLPSGQVLTDSWEIANASGLQPLSNETLIRMYDAELGPLARQYAYHYLLKAEHRSLWDELLCHKQGWLWRFCYFFIGSSLHATMSKLFGLGKPNLFIDCEKKIDVLLSRIEQRLPKQSRYINGAHISVEDVALCALMAPMLLPPKYCGGEFNSIFMKFEAQDTDFHEKLKFYRNTPVGKYVMHIYEENRDAMPLA